MAHHPYWGRRQPVPATMNLRMRQICLVARQLAPVVDDFREVFGLEACYRDPGVGKYGLENALFPIGNGFLEVVAPVRDGTTAGRYLDRRGGDGGWHPAASKATSRGPATMRAMQAAELQGDDADKLAQRWSDVTTLPLGRDERGRPTLALDDASLRFVSATDGRGEGLAGIDLACADREGVLARARAHGLPVQGNVVTACGIRFALV